MPTIDLHEKPFDEGTITKLDVFQRYLESWLPVFIHSPGTNELNICDFFAGTGSDIEGRPGSPLLILKIVNAYKEQILQKKVKVNIILNDFTKSKYDCLKDTISAEAKELCELSEYLEISFHNADFIDLFDELKGKLWDKPNIIFIDQNGIKFVDKDRINDLEKFLMTDYIFFCSSSYVKRFGFENYLPGLNFSKGIKHTNVHRELLSYYRSLLPNDSPTKLYPFTIKKKGNIYGLIFGSKHPLGVDKFLHVAWGKNPINGDANFDIDEDLDKQQLLLFEKPRLTKIQGFQRQLEDLILSNNTITNEDIYHFTLENGFIPKHATEVLASLRKRKLIEPYSYAYLTYKQIFTHNKIVEFRKV